MKTNPNTNTQPNPNTEPNFSFEDETKELNDQDLMMIVGAGSRTRDPEAEEEANNNVRLGNVRNWPADS